MGSIISRLFNSNVLDKNSTRFEFNENIDSKTVNNNQLISNTRHLPSIVTNRKPSMDVTKQNFLEILREIDSVISDSLFMAIDTELTGLKRPDCKNLQVLDTTDDRYSKLRQSIAGFNLIQFGLTCFKAIDTTTDDEISYECNSYNFYIFPQKSVAINKSMGDRVFSIQSSSLQFLVNNGFDFNKLIIDGISYLNVAEEKLCLETIKAQNEFKRSADKTSVTSASSDEDKKFVEEILVKVKKFLEEEDNKTLDLSPCNAFKRRLIYELLKSQDFIDSIEIKTVQVSHNSMERYLSISKIDRLEKERKDEESLTEAIGFSKVIQMIIKYQKPIVGHNILLDLMHTFNQFIEPLPKDYQPFKESIHALFPIIYDTKHMASSLPFKDLLNFTALGDLYDRLKKSPFKAPKVELMNGKHLEGRPLHEAGYDSYVTGVCFISLSHYLGSLTQPKVQRFDPILMNDYQNKMHLTFSHDIRYLNFETDDIVPNRDHVFHMTFPKEWKTTELSQMFSAFGGVSIHWLNDTSAFCALKDPSNTDKIKKSLVKHSSGTYKVISYNDFITKSQNHSKEEDIRDSIKRNSKTRSSPQPTNQYKKSKVVSSNTKPSKKQKSRHHKLFDEPNEWPVDVEPE